MGCCDGSGKLQALKLCSTLLSFHVFPNLAHRCSRCDVFMSNFHNGSISLQKLIYFYSHHQHVLNFSDWKIKKKTCECSFYHLNDAFVNMCLRQFCGYSLSRKSRWLKTRNESLACSSCVISIFFHSYCRFFSYCVFVCLPASFLLCVFHYVSLIFFFFTIFFPPFFSSPHVPFFPPSVFPHRGLCALSYLLTLFLSLILAVIGHMLSFSSVHKHKHISRRARDAKR